LCVNSKTFNKILIKQLLEAFVADVAEALVPYFPTFGCFYGGQRVLWLLFFRDIF